MNTTTKQTQLFFLITLIFTLPTYVLVALVSSNIILAPDMATYFLPLGAIAPIGAGLMVTFRESGKAGMKDLFKRGFDLKRIKNRKWYIPIILLFPFLFAVAYGLLILFKQSIPEAPSPLYFIPMLFLTFFVLGFGEEVGWMGYAFDSSQKKSGLIRSTILLALIWPLWHVPFYIFMINDLSSILLMLLCLFGARIIFVWVYNKTNQSVFAVIILHAMFNISISVTPNYSLPTGIVVTAALIMIAVAAISLSGGFKPKSDLT